MVLVRQNVWELDEWADPILWYARGVAEMRSRPLADPTSWAFYAAIHGFDQVKWTRMGLLPPNPTFPNRGLIAQFWEQCQHGSWYFLPWHRGYVAAFEATVRAAVVGLGGPDDWTLPYWNYFKPGQAELPAAFASPDWPDGNGDNPLFEAARYGPQNDGHVYVPLKQVNLHAMSDPAFTGVSSGGSPGFGGIDTGFSHGGRHHGGIETQPHDWVHGLVGGNDPQPPHYDGLMGDPDTAGSDPIFWLHHANIDRLWVIWNQSAPSHVDPPSPFWSAGPASRGKRAFVMPLPTGRVWTYTPAEMVNTEALNYVYDDLSPADVTIARDARRRARGLQPLGEADFVANDESVELVGANTEAITLGGAEQTIAVNVDAPAHQRMLRNMAFDQDAATRAATPPERVFLNLENVRGTSGSAAFDVYIDAAGDPTEAAQLAGSIAPFGVAQASDPDGEHGGAGLTFVLDITDIVEDLHLSGQLDPNQLDIRLVPINTNTDLPGLTIGRIGIYRQGQ